ncbi:hypothetical protein [Pseudomonas sp. RC10]|uniref:hypothetical protein n=1 Tax=Pseudomonas bambusae TaxID=3139142 RepID=UPI00313968F4
MTVAFETVRLTLTGRMAAFTGIEQSRVEYANAKVPSSPTGLFVRPTTGLWCAFEILYATAFLAGMADKPQYRRPGQIVIQCFCLKREGLSAINKLADALSDHFQAWQSGEIECMEASQVVVGDYESFYQINVNVRFRAG